MEFGAERYFRCCLQIDFNFLELYGKEYVIEYAVNRSNELYYEEARDYYITDTLWVLARVGTLDKAKIERFSDLIERQKNQGKEEETESAEEIIERIRKGLSK